MLFLRFCRQISKKGWRLKRTGRACRTNGKKGRFDTCDPFTFFKEIERSFTFGFVQKCILTACLGQKKCHNGLVSLILRYKQKNPMTLRKTTSLSTAGALGALCALGASATAAPSPQRPPNIVFFYLDDMGWTDGSCFG